MSDLERYLVGEHIEDFAAGLIGRRELLRRVTLITGSIASTLVLLEAAGCQSEPSTKPVSPESRQSSKAQPFATPPARPTSNGVTVAPDDARITIAPMTVTGADGVSLISYHARPSSGEPAGGILVVHENRGLVAHINDVVRRVATAGFCFGGGMTWNALAAGTAVQAAVPFYGPPPKNVAGLATTKAAVLAIYAERDTRITNTKDQIEKQLSRTSHPYQIKVYPGVDHAFHNDTGARYNATQAEAAWLATINWFHHYVH